MERIFVTLSVIVLSLAAFLTSAGTTFAQSSYEGVRRFDCGALFSSLDLGAGGGRTSELLVGPFSRNEQTVSSDPASAIELLKLNQDGQANQAYVRVSPPHSNNSGAFVGCVLLVVEIRANYLNLRANEQGAEALPIWMNERDATRLPILLIDEFQNEPNFNRFYEAFAKSYFAIPLNFSKVGIEDSFGTLSHEVFGKIDFFPTSPKWSAEHVQFVPTSNIQGNLQGFLSEAAHNAPFMGVMCGKKACDVLWQGFQPSPGVGGSATISDVQDPIYTQDPDPEGVPPLPAGQASAIEAGVAEANEVSGQPPRDQLSPYMPFEALVTYDSESGPSSDGLDKVGGLACILAAVEPELFESTPSCDRGFQALLARSPKLVISEDGGWHLTPRVATFASKLVVTAPATASSSCELGFRLPGNDKMHPLEPVPNTAPRAFSAPLEAFELETGTETEVTIFVRDEAACGIKTQVLPIMIEDEIQISLEVRDRPKREVAYVMAVNRNDLAEELGLGDQSSRFGQSLINAVEAAHARLAADVRGQAMALTHASLFSLDGSQDLSSLVSLTAAAMQSNPAGSFATITTGSRESIGRATAIVSAKDTGLALRKLVDEAARREANALDIVLLGASSGRTTRGANDACSDVKYIELFEQLRQVSPIDTRLWVFPLSRLQENEQPSLERMTLIAGPGTSATELLQAPVNGGLYRCAGLPRGLNVLPYFFEHWRANVEVPARYGVSLSDALTPILFDLASEE